LVHVAAAQDVRNLRSPRLWSRYLVSLLTIGSAYAAFSYFTPLLEQTAGFSSDATTVILLGHGICSFIGNLVVGRFADRHAVAVLRSGHALLFIALALLAHFGQVSLVVVVTVLIVGVAGVTMNPALVTISLFGDDPAVAIWTGVVFAVLAAVVLAMQTTRRALYPAT
jgi:DHA1 family inner membrane transport protein